MNKKYSNIKPQAETNFQSYANQFKKNNKKENNNNIEYIDKSSNKINIKNNQPLNFDQINDWGNIVYPNDQNINECINKLNIKEDQSQNNANDNKGHLIKDNISSNNLLKILKEEENNENDSEDEQLKIIQKKLRNGFNNKKVKIQKVIIKRNEINNNINNNNEYSIATSMFTSKNDGVNINDKIDIVGNVNNLKQNFNKNQGNILFNDNSISQIKKNENINHQIKEEINELNHLEKDSLDGDNVNYNMNNISNNNLSANQMNDLENDINRNNQNFNENNNYTNINNNSENNGIIQLPKYNGMNKLGSKTTKNRNRKKNNFKPKSQQNQIMNYNLINFNSNQNQIIPPLINNPMMMNNPYMLNNDMNNQFIYNQPPPNYPTLPPLPPLPQNNFPYQQYQYPPPGFPFPFMNEYDNYDNMNNFGNGFDVNYYGEGGMQMFNQEMPPPLMMKNDYNQKNNNKKKIVRKFKQKFRSNINDNKNNNKNQSENKIDNNINKKIPIKDKNPNIVKKNNKKTNPETKAPNILEKEKSINNKEEFHKNISQNISEIKPEESKSNINKSLETDKTDEKDKSISHQIGYLSQLKRNKEKQIKNLEEKEKQRKLSKFKANIKKYEEQNEIKLGRIYTTLGQKKQIKYKTASVHKGKMSNKYNYGINKDLFLEKDLNKNGMDGNIFNGKENKENDGYDIENLLLKKMQFENQIKEIKKFIKK